MKTRIFSLLLAVLLMVALAVPAAAASTVTFTSKSSITLADGTAYHATDLFPNFKNVMPGDTLQDTVTISNKISGSSYITVYLKAVPHDENNAPAYSTQQAEADGKAIESVESLNDFLSQLTLKVTQGKKVIYEGHPNDPGQLKNAVKLGKITKGRKMELTVTLSVPIEMGNEYMDRVGEVDWVFYADIVEGNNLIQTGQLNWPIPVLGTLGLGLIVLGFWLSRKKKKNA